jgi:hypothetical protein
VAPFHAGGERGRSKNGHREAHGDRDGDPQGDGQAAAADDRRAAVDGRCPGIRVHDRQDDVAAGGDQHRYPLRLLKGRLAGR